MFVARLSLAGYALSWSLLLVTGCSESTSRSDADELSEAEQRELGRDTDETVFDDLIETQDKARAVEDLTLGRKDELDRALDSATGEEPPADE